MLSKSRQMLLAILIILSIILAGCKSPASSGGDNEPTPTPIPPPPIPEKPTYTVQRGEVVNAVSFTGRVAPSIEEEMFFKESGRVKKVYVDRNAVVEAGALLAELENDDLTRQLSQAQIELESSQLDVDNATKERQFAIDQANIDLQMEQTKLAKLQESLASTKLDLQVAAIELKQAKEGPSAEDLAIAQSQVERAKNGLWSAQIDRDSTCGQGKGAACDGAQAGVQSAEQEVRIAELNLQKLTKPVSADDLAIAQADYQKLLSEQKQTEYDV
jgi:multidrug efflux pump subunit AcrA (membrane-fusion protein)